MKRWLGVVSAALVSLTVAMPALADLNINYGGQFRVRFENSNNVVDGTQSQFSTNYNSDDNRCYIDQRMRMRIVISSSENLKLVTKWELGDTKWGDPQGRVGPGSGGGVGADGVSLETKNIYVEFKIPNTPITTTMGIQTMVLLDSWVIDDDFAGAVFTGKFEPFTASLGYIAAQRGAERNASTSLMPYTDSRFNIDSVFASFDYAQGPIKASLIGFFQDGHNTDVSINPATLATPVSSYRGVFPTGGGSDIYAFTAGLQPKDNYLFDLAFNITYKVDWLMAYVNFVRNFGGADLRIPNTDTTYGNVTSVDYKGWMVDAGVTYYTGPYTFNVGGFYTSGPKISDNPSEQGNPFTGLSSKNVDWFTYPLATSKYFSEIVGGGVLGDDIYTYRGWSGSQGAGGMGYGESLSTVYWRGYGFPTNLWTITTGGSWQIDQKTKLSGSYWYFGTAEAVPVQIDTRRQRYNMSSSIGHEFNVYLDRQIVDNLTLTLVGAYLLADDAWAPLPVTGFRALPQDANGVSKLLRDDAFELGARIQWNF